MHTKINEVGRFKTGKGNRYVCAVREYLGVGFTVHREASEFCGQQQEQQHKGGTQHSEGHTTLP